jgi:hypothetical protein
MLKLRPTNALDEEIYPDMSIFASVASGPNVTFCGPPEAFPPPMKEVITPKASPTKGIAFSVFDKNFRPLPPDDGLPLFEFVDPVLPVFG